MFSFISQLPAEIHTSQMSLAQLEMLLKNIFVLAVDELLSHCLQPVGSARQFTRSLRSTVYITTAYELQHLMSCTDPLPCCN